ncbi:helix-turn-helix domain-containing protein [Spirillospora sp. NPDC127200]
MRKRAQLLRALREGSELAQAAELVGVTVRTVKRTRLREPLFDAEVVLAAREAGRRLRPLNAPVCPGSACGTAYGYDTAGCRRTLCRDAKVGRRLSS